MIDPSKDIKDALKLEEAVNEFYKSNGRKRPIELTKSVRDLIERFDGVFANYAARDDADAKVMAKNAKDLQTMIRAYGYIVGVMMEDSQVEMWKLHAQVNGMIAAKAQEELKEFTTIFKLKAMSPDRLDFYAAMSEDFFDGKNREEIIKGIKERVTS